ncbi:phosphatidylserine/phosphatidylglycerophosphate/cardiolipin synthase [Burkholderia sp. Ac-20353]|uniref:phosphatidylserine/phosphatidylglycerophosphate/ cardiolipin synthase n=1 Tax=Burkholderia sp. Ac-20353 TaxID=2703894 RepID=UPI00197BA37B|nr:phosphatidylserine/phosphatidylglycerophosphate/cardiolipin synthase [Burkholderia sp. Ac-20353]MBN3788285.1 phosphatidylserine/phosphatidylglycerophosphate/cardiolipin synthase [Burkholderia sp. Ac-20353]
MSVFAVNGVRIDPRSGRVTHVRWGQVNAAGRAWIAAPREAPVAEVVRAVVGGDDVHVIFDASGDHVAGPKLKSVVYRDATEGIELDVDATREARTLRDLPQI